MSEHGLNSSSKTPPEHVGRPLAISWFTDVQTAWQEREHRANTERTWREHNLNRSPKSPPEHVGRPLALSWFTGVQTAWQEREHRAKGTEDV